MLQAFAIDTLKEFLNESIIVKYEQSKTATGFYAEKTSISSHHSIYFASSDSRIIAGTHALIFTARIPQYEVLIYRIKVARRVLSKEELISFKIVSYES